MNNNARVYALRAAISTVGIDRAPPGAKKESLSLFSAGENLQSDAELGGAPPAAFTLYIISPMRLRYHIGRCDRMRYHSAEATVYHIAEQCESAPRLQRKEATTAQNL